MKTSIFAAIKLTALGLATLGLSACGDGGSVDYATLDFDQLAKKIEKASSLEAIAAGVTPGHAKVEGDNAAFLLPSDESEGDQPVVILTAQKNGDAWVVGPRQTNMGFFAKASSSFEVSGAQTATVTNAQVGVSILNGFPTIIVSDLLAAGLKGEDGDAPYVQLPLPFEFYNACLEPGNMPLETIVYAGQSNFTIHGGYVVPLEDRDDDIDYVQGFKGTLAIESVEGTRFSGRYDFTSANKSGNEISVSGTLDNALMPCKTP